MATARELLAKDHPELAIEKEWGGCYYCPHDYGYLPRPDYCYAGLLKNGATIEDCRMCWDREVPEDSPSLNAARGGVTVGEAILEGIKNVTVNPKEIRKEHLHYKEEKITLNELRETMGLPPITVTGSADIPRILDSGNRREFESGAVRDIQEGKGRCDLLPLDVVGQALGDEVIKSIYSFVNSGDERLLYCTLSLFNEKLGCDKYTLILEVAKHFEEGAKKYGDRNWEKGIPVHCYIDSGVRHYLKFLRGDKDEPHDRAFCWNMLCAIWTCKHKPELNEYGGEFLKKEMVIDEKNSNFICS